MVMKQKRFMEDPVLYIYKGYIFFSTCENVWLHRLILCQCPCVVFPPWSSLVEQVFHAMAIKTMELYVLPYLESIAIVFLNFDLWTFRSVIDTFAFVINYLA
jgi:hypothetical protein